MEDNAENSNIKVKVEMTPWEWHVLLSLLGDYMKVASIPGMLNSPQNKKAMYEKIASQLNDNKVVIGD